MRRNLSTKIINITFLVPLTLLIPVFIAKKEYLYVVETASVFILYLLFLLYEYINGIVIKDFIRISVLASVLSNSFFGEFMGLFKTSFYFDKLLHVFGTFSFTAFLFSIAQKKGYFRHISSRFMVFIFILLLGSFLGMVYEIGEYIIDVIFKTKNQGSIADNNIDMICDILGAALAGIFVIYQKKEPSKSKENI